MKSSSKVLLVAAGYLAALADAFGVVGIHIAATYGPETQASGGMSAFGDSVLFLGVFAVAAMPASGAALYFLRPFHTLWHIGSVAALAIATTGIGAFATYLSPLSAHMAPWLGEWSPLRILLAPLLAMAFLLSGLIAPTRPSRLALLCASLIEIVVFVWVALIALIGVHALQ